MRGRHSDLSSPHAPYTCTASPIVSMPHQSGTFATINEPAATQHHPKTMVCIKVRSCCCEFCGVGKTYNAVYLSLWYSAAYFPLCSVHLSLLISPHPPHTYTLLAVTDLFTVFTVLAFPERHIVGIIQ